MVKGVQWQFRRRMRLVLQRVDDRFPALKIVIESLDKNDATEAQDLSKVKEHNNVIGHKDTEVVHRTCKICGLVVKRQRYLKVHSLIHTDKKPHRCKICGHTFLHRHNLVTHRVTHTGRRGFQCRVCKKSFFYESSLKFHERHHSQDEGYECFTCGKTFMQKSDLKVHAYIHIGVKPHDCHICGQTFRQVSHLFSHARKIHSIQLPRKTYMREIPRAKKGKMRHAFTVKN